MEFEIMFKTPDAFDAAQFDDDTLAFQAKMVFDKFVKYGEIIKIKFDTVKGTAEVVS